jgi:DNA-binding CsgD family transcriptional regulator
VDDRAAAILELLFHAPGDMRAWWPFFEALGGAISPDVRVATLVESHSEPVATAAFFVGAQHTAAGLLPLRPQQRRQVDALAPGVVFDVPRFGREFREHPVVQNLLEPEGVVPGPGLGVVIARDLDSATAALLVLPRKPGWAPTPADRALLGAVAPYLPQAARLHAQLLGTSAVTTLLDQLVLGVVLLDDQGRVSYANMSAAELIGGEPGFVPPGQRGTRSDGLYRTVQGGNRSLYRHPVDGRPLQLLATPLAWPNPFGAPARQFARAVFIGDPQRNSGDPIENLGLVYGLTPAETRLAWLLVGDRTLAEAAAQLGITQSTARTVLKRILAKTGTRRQASLVRLLLSGPAQLRGAAAPPGALAPRAKPRGRRG